MEDEHRILILGCGEAGKSTFIKQMQIIHSEGLGNDDKRKGYKSTIADNIMSAINTLIENMSFVHENQLHDDDDLAEAVQRLEVLEGCWMGVFVNIHSQVESNEKIPEENSKSLRGW